MLSSLLFDSADIDIAILARTILEVILLPAERCPLHPHVQTPRIILYELGVKRKICWVFLNIEGGVPVNSVSIDINMHSFMERSITGSRSAKFAFVTSILPVLRSKVLAQNNRFSSKKRTKGTHQRTNCLLAEGRWEGTTVGELKQYPITLRSLSLAFFLYLLSSPLPSTEPAVHCFPACYFLIEMRRRQERRSIAL